MATNLLETLKSTVGMELAEHSSNFFDEEQQNTRSAVNGTFAAILAGMIQRVSYDKGANDLHKILKKENVRDYDIEDIFTRSPQTVNGMVNRGTHFLPSIYPGKFREATNTVASESSVKKVTSSKMMKICAPLMLNTIGKHVQENKLDVSGLKSYLNGQKSAVQSSLPQEFFTNAELSAFGWSKDKIEAEQRAKDEAKERAEIEKREKRLERERIKEEKKLAAAEPAPEENLGRAATGGMSILKWLLPLILLIGLAWFIISRVGCAGADKVATTVAAPVEAVQTAATKAADATTSAVSNVLGSVNDAALGALNSIKFAAGSAGEQMMGFIKGGASGEGRFRFTNLTFATGSAAIDGESGAEVDNMAAILKAYPDVKVSVEGYTDNTGNPAGNQSLSQQRAESVVNRLVASGIDASRMTATGYGDANPVADNGTPEGRAQNRRIEVVVQK